VVTPYTHEHTRAQGEGEGPEAATAMGGSEESMPACAICLSDFERGEHAMVFKKCG
jgi:hypothetical protein